MPRAVPPAPSGVRRAKLRWLEELGFAFERHTSGSHSLWRHRRTGNRICVSPQAASGRDPRGLKNLQAQARRAADSLPERY